MLSTAFTSPKLLETRASWTTERLFGEEVATTRRKSFAGRAGGDEVNGATPRKRLERTPTVVPVESERQPL
jgi:hypothetical protein